MSRLIKSGIDFESLARESLEGKFGGSADVLLRGLSPAALTQPEAFVRELTEMFGQGADGVLEPMSKYAEMGIYGTNLNTMMLRMLNRLGPPPAVATERESILLHNHRVVDEQGNYASRFGR
jgi:hypothetical protein